MIPAGVAVVKNGKSVIILSYLLNRIYLKTYSIISSTEEKIEEFKMRYIDTKEAKAVFLLLAMIVAVAILCFPNMTYEFFGRNIAMWRMFTGTAVVGVSWIFLKPLLGATLEDAVNEATLITSVMVILITIAYWHSVWSLVPVLAAAAFAFQTGKHRFFS